ncbi:MAG: hypothetical protein ABR568_07185 [Pyrinomonadaceae bacterium]
MERLPAGGARASHPGQSHSEAWTDSWRQFLNSMGQSRAEAGIELRTPDPELNAEGSVF